jgi:hypothetical protein
MGCWQKQLGSCLEQLGNSVEQLGSCLRLVGGCLELLDNKVKGFREQLGGSLRLDWALLWILFHNFDTDQEQGFLLGCSFVPKQTRNNINCVACVYIEDFRLFKKVIMLQKTS